MLWFYFPLIPSLMLFFMGIQLSDLHHFLSLWRTYFNISCEADPLASTCLSDKLFLLHFWRMIALIQILGWWFFFFYINTLNNSLHSSCCMAQPVYDLLCSALPERLSPVNYTFLAPLQTCLSWVWSAGGTDIRPKAGRQKMVWGIFSPIRSTLFGA